MQQNLQEHYDYPSFSDDEVAFEECNQHNGFVGEKIGIEELINKKIVFLDFYEMESRFKRFGDTVLMIQIILDGEKRVVFTQSKRIAKTLKIFKDKLPRSGTIVKENRALFIK